jgi:hypothetical protein
MSTQELAARIQTAVDTAGRAFRDERRRVASGQLFDAIQIALNAPPGELRLKELVRLGQFCMQVRFEDLGLVALVDAVAELEAAGDYRAAGNVMLDVASTFAQLLNVDEAVHWNQRALTTSLEHSHYANAASASTNLAMQFAYILQDLPRAHELALASLDYLKREAFPHTETVTRALLTILADKLDRPAEEAISIARPLFDSLRDIKVSDQLRREAVEAIENLARRHLAAHPELDAAAWRRVQLPELWGGAA